MHNKSVFVTPNIISFSNADVYITYDRENRENRERDKIFYSTKEYINMLQL